MDRYQFEDQISDYIENQLSIQQRKEFETYLQDHPEAKAMVISVQKLMQTMRTLPALKTSDNFMSNLNRRIVAEKEKITKPLFTRNFKGYVPVMAALSTVIVLAVIIISKEYIPNHSTQSNVLPSVTIDTPQQKPIITPITNPQLLSEAEEDTLLEDMDKPTQRKLDDNLKLVGNKRP